MTLLKSKISDYIIALERNEVIQFGVLESIIHQPASPWLTKFFDLNLISGVATGLEFKSDCGELFNCLNITPETYK